MTFEDFVVTRAGPTSDEAETLNALARWADDLTGEWVAPVNYDPAVLFVFEVDEGHPASAWVDGPVYLVDESQE